MNQNLLNPEVQKFIETNTGCDTGKLALSKNPFPQVDWAEILNQIAARTKAAAKLPTWFAAENIIWPSKISLEQTSSEKTAFYKSNLVNGNSLIDLTGGFGVDDYYFSKQLSSVVYCEINPDLAAITRHNFIQLNAANIDCHLGDGLEILRRFDRKFDWIYIDPSRRNDSKGKVFMLRDCRPEVPVNLEMYFSHADQIMIKVSPLLDISAGLVELKNVREIHVVAVRNEVKELLWILKKDYSGPIEIKTVDIQKEGMHEFGFSLGKDIDATFSLPKDFLYEPNAAIMKSGGFDQVSAGFNVQKLHPNSHLYTSERLVENFPGRSFKIIEVLSYGKSEMKKIVKSKANVTVRNFPESVESVRKKWKLSDGGETFYFFTTNENNEKIVLICAKL